MNHRIALPVVLASLSILGACTAGVDEDVGAGEGDIKIKPADSELLGALLLSRASGVDTAIPGERGTFAGVTLEVGAPARMNPASGCVKFASNAFSLPTEACGVAVERSRTTEVKLAAVKVTYDQTSDEGRLRTDFGPRASLVVSQAQQGGLVAVSDGQHVGFRTNPATAEWVSLLGGEYTFSFGPKVLEPRTVRLGPDSKTELDLTPATDVRATIAIKWPTRENPDAKHVNYPQCAMNHSYLVHRSIDRTDDGSPTYHGDDGVVSFQRLDLASNATFKVFPFTASEAPHHYEVVVNNVIVKVDARPGQTVTIPIERLDVDDVEIVTEAGDRRYVKGTYQVFRREGSTWRLLSLWDRRTNCSTVASMLNTFPTGTGIDVPSGTYKVVVKYTTADGAKSQEHVVTVP
jgi:hypothetical protein